MNSLKPTKFGNTSVPALLTHITPLMARGGVLTAYSMYGSVKTPVEIDGHVVVIKDPEFSVLMQRGPLGIVLRTNDDGCTKVYGFQAAVNKRGKCTLTRISKNVNTQCQTHCTFTGKYIGHEANVEYM